MVSDSYHNHLYLTRDSVTSLEEFQILISSSNCKLIALNHITSVLEQWTLMSDCTWPCNWAIEQCLVFTPVEWMHDIVFVGMHACVPVSVCESVCV